MKLTKISKAVWGALGVLFLAGAANFGLSDAPDQETVQLAITTIAQAIGAWLVIYLAPKNQE